MKTRFLILSIFCLLAYSVYAENISYGNMKQWRTHLSYNDVTELADAGTVMYALAGGALFAIDKTTEEITYYSKQNGLHGSNISNIAFDKQSRILLITYEDGLMDFIVNNEFYVFTDLANQQLSGEKQTNSIYIHDSKAYLGMPFGILVVNMKKREIADTYFLGQNSTEINIKQVSILGDSIYAISNDSLYIANLHDNLSDFNNWHTDKALQHTDTNTQNTHIVVCNNSIYILQGTKLFTRTPQTSWSQSYTTYNWTNLILSDNHLFGTDGTYTYLLSNSGVEIVPNAPSAFDVIYDNPDIWLAAGGHGVVKIDKDNKPFPYFGTGPFENYSFRVKIEGDKLIMVPGMYEGLSFMQHPGGVMLYENDIWTNYNIINFMSWNNGVYTTDFCDAAIDPYDHSHFFISSYGHGLLEFKNNTFYKRYSAHTLVQFGNEWHPAIDSIGKIISPLGFKEEPYTWVHAIQFDSKGNLWITNSSLDMYNLKVLTRTGQWYRYKNEAVKGLDWRRHNLIVLKKNENIKLISSMKKEAGIGIFNDNGTLANTADDKAVFVSSFIDQDNKTILPEYIHHLCQMMDGSIWVGTSDGLFIIDDPTTLFTSNKCRRIKIPRNDGTNLADYLLDGEEVRYIEEDGAGRKWIGTLSSGIYVMSSDGIETIEHFTTNNSPLPSDQISCITMHPKTGEVFIGTGAGLVSYQNDAVTPSKDFDNAYAYPNPVWPNFQGTITITGLMANTVVYILDSGGNLVCKTRSNGGIATWDGKNLHGRRVASGIYTVMCNTANGENHAVTKIMIM